MAHNNSVIPSGRHLTIYATTRREGSHVSVQGCERSLDFARKLAEFTPSEAEGLGMTELLWAFELKPYIASSAKLSAPEIAMGRGLGGDAVGLRGSPWGLFTKTGAGDRHRPLYRV
jgi:hypothetical protein